MISNGLITKWHKDYWPDRMVCSRKREQVATLEDTQSIFFMLGIALLIACAVLVMENIYKNILLNGEKYKSLLSRIKLASFFSQIHGHKRGKHNIMPLEDGELKPDLNDTPSQGYYLYG